MRLCACRRELHVNGAPLHVEQRREPRLTTHLPAFSPNCSAAWRTCHGGSGVKHTALALQPLHDPHQALESWQVGPRGTRRRCRFARAAALLVALRMLSPSACIVSGWRKVASGGGARCVAQARRVCLRPNVLIHLLYMLRLSRSRHCAVRHIWPPCCSALVHWCGCRSGQHDHPIAMASATMHLQQCKCSNAWSLKITDLVQRRGAIFAHQKRAGDGL